MDYPLAYQRDDPVYTCGQQVVRRASEAPPRAVMAVRAVDLLTQAIRGRGCDLRVAGESAPLCKGSLACRRPQVPLWRGTIVMQTTLV